MLERSPAPERKDTSGPFRNLMLNHLLKIRVGTFLTKPHPHHTRWRPQVPSEGWRVHGPAGRHVNHDLPRLNDTRNHPSIRTCKRAEGRRLPRVSRDTVFNRKELETNSTSIKGKPVNAHSYQRTLCDSAVGVCMLVQEHLQEIPLTK